jgi:tagatose 1,6-diphosphate aldolase
MRTPFDPGITRSLQRVASDDGFVLVCAVDHLAEFEELLGKVGTVPFGDVVRAKAEVIAAVTGSASAILLDPGFGIGHLVASGALPARTGLIASIEEENYRFPNGPRGSIMRAGWTAAKAKAAGADLVKFLWFYRPDLDAAVASAQRALLGQIRNECVAASIPLVVEPIWYPIETEDAASAAWQAARFDGIISSAIEAESIGLEMLKVEFPGDVSTEAGRAAATIACERLAASTSSPWVILSAGVSFDDFLVQLTIACHSGASGYMAGRSVWKDAVTSGDVTAVRTRIDALNAIVREHGTPLSPTVPLETLIAEVPKDWYVGYREHRA